jgi:hypothetical protein
MNINFTVFDGGKKETWRKEERLLLLLFFLHTFPASNLSVPLSLISSDLALEVSIVSYWSTSKPAARSDLTVI